MQAFTKGSLRSKLAIVGALLFFLGVVAFWYTDGFDVSSTLPMATSAPRPVATSEKKPPEKKYQPKQPETGVREDVSASQNSVPQVDMGTLQTFSAKQAKLEETKLDVAIAEQQAKLQELREGKKAPVVSAPVQLPQLPFLPPPSEVVPASRPLADVLADLPVSPPSRRSGLVAIQGLDGALSAVFATSNGKKTVRVGDVYAGSRVRSITLDGVTLASGKTVTFED